MTTWLITGCSTGFGRSLAECVLKAGANAVVTARDAASVADIVAPYGKTAVATALDVTDNAAVAAAVALGEARFDGIDVLVNNAGYGYRGAVEEGDDAEVRALFDTNVFGTIATIKAVLPGMRKRRSGTILNFSSIAGRLAFPGSGYYSATKFAVAGMSEALRKEVAPLGIRVTVVEPAGFRTDFAGRSLMQAKAKIADYAETAGKRRKENDTSHGRQPGDPERAAQVLIDLVAGRDLPARLLLGSDALAIVTPEIEHQLKEIAAWKTVSAGTDYPKT